MPGSAQAFGPVWAGVAAAFAHGFSVSMVQVLTQTFSRLNCLDLQASTFHLHFQCVRLILQVSVGNFQLHGMQPKQLGGFHRLALAVSLEGNCTVFESTSGA